MSFLNPLMLLGGAAIAIPIVIHLLNKRKFQRVVWAAMRFLQASVEQNQRRLKLEDILLLLLRCLLILLIVFAMSRPLSCSGTGGGVFGKQAVTGVVILDNSYSMSHTDGVKSRFALAKDAIDAVVNQAPSGSSMALLLGSDVVDPLIPEPTLDLNLVRQEVREASLSDRGSDLLPAIQQAVQMLQARPGARKEIYVVSDSQRQAYANLNAITQLVDENSGEINFRFIVVDQPGERNIGVSKLARGPSIASLNQRVRFQVTVQNFGSQDERNVRVALRLNGDPPSDEAVIEDLPAGDSRTISMFARLRSDGFHTVTASVPADNLPADDTRTMALRAVTDVRVLLVDGEPGQRRRDSEVFFLRNAIAPIGRAESGDYFLKTDVISTTLALQAARFDEYHAVFLCNVTDMSEKTVDQLAAYVRQGGGLVILPGDNSRVDFYNRQFFERTGLLPARLSDAVGDADDDETWFRLQRSGFEHEIAELWSDAKAGSPAAAPIYRAFPLTPDERTVSELEKLTGAAPSPGEKAISPAIGPPRTVLRFGDIRENGALANTPAVIERSYGFGRVVLFSTTADTEWNLIAAKTPGVYLPLMQRVLGALVQKQEAALTVSVGEQFAYYPDARTFGELRSPLDLVGKDAVMRMPGGEDARREIQRINLVNRLPAMRFQETPLQGGYDVSVIGEPLATLRFAVQADYDESSLASIGESELERLRQRSQVTSWKAGAVIQDDAVAQQNAGVELWGYLALFAVLLAASETLLAHWFSQSK